MGYLMACESEHANVHREYREHRERGESASLCEHQPQIVNLEAQVALHLDAAQNVP
jgi:hypothetical protein